MATIKGVGLASLVGLYTYMPKPRNISESRAAQYRILRTDVVGVRPDVAGNLLKLILSGVDAEGGQRSDCERLE